MRFWAIVGVLFFFVSFISCAGQKPVKVSTGQRIGNANVVFDVEYNSSLDALIPGYKVVTVAISNQNFKPFMLDPEQDEWKVVANSGKSWKASSSLKQSNEKLWYSLSPEFRHRLSYPLMIPHGSVETVDLFVSDKAKLENFRGILFKSSFLGATIEVENIYR